jgi:hypothetical protein
MQTLPNLSTHRKSTKAFYATVYDLPARLVKVDDAIYVVTDDDVQPFDVEMAPFTCVLGECGIAQTQQLLDRMHGSYPAIACKRDMGRS